MHVAIMGLFLIIVLFTHIVIIVRRNNKFKSKVEKVKKVRGSKSKVKNE